MMIIEAVEVAAAVAVLIIILIPLIIASINRARGVKRKAFGRLGQIFIPRIYNPARMDTR